MVKNMHDPSLHLFVDDHHIRNLFGMKRVFEKPEKLGPVIESNPGRNVNWGCVRQEDDGRIRMWYLSCSGINAHEAATAGAWGSGETYGFFPEKYRGAAPVTKLVMVAYAESADGIKWDKPALGLVELDGTKDNNYVLDGSIAANPLQRSILQLSFAI